jgi:uncharacterized protein (DUF697 family)
VAGLPVSVGTLRAVVKEIVVSAQSAKPLVVGGAPLLAHTLRRELGVAGSDDPRGAAVYVHIWSGDGTDEGTLKQARRAQVPIVALAAPEVDAVPFVLATDIVPLEPGRGFPVAALARTIAGRLGEDAAPRAARVPVLRRAVADELISSFARRNGLIGAASFVSGVDLPALLRNQLRLLLRLHQAYGLSPDPRERLPEIGLTVAAGLGLRAVARELLGLVPGAGWAVKGGVAYAGTRALGEAALRRLEIGSPGGHGLRRPPGGASPAAP